MTQQQLEVSDLVASIHNDSGKMSTQECNDHLESVIGHCVNDCEQRIEAALKDCADEVERLKARYEAALESVKNAPNVWEQRARLEYAEAIAWKQRAANLEDAAAYWKKEASSWQSQAEGAKYYFNQIRVEKKALEGNLSRAQATATIAIALAAICLLVAVL